MQRLPRTNLRITNIYPVDVGGRVVPVRIAMIAAPLDISEGGARQCLHLAIELGRQGHVVKVFTPRADPEKCFPDLMKSVNVHAVGSSEPLAFAGRLAGAAGFYSMSRVEMLGVAKHIPKEFDIINCHDQSGNWPAAFARRRIGAPAVWMCNEPPFWYHTPASKHPWQRAVFRGPLRFLDPEGLFLMTVDRPAAKLMDRIAVLDRKNARRIEELYGRTATVVRTGVDHEFFARRRGKHATGDSSSGGFQLLLVGYAAPWKGQREALLTLARIRKANPQVSLTLAGRGVKDYCKALVDELGLQGNVVFQEGFSDEELARMYESADVVLFPADQTWGLTVVEAMAAGKPVIVSDAAGVSEVIRDGETGFVVPHGDVDALLRRVLELLGDEHLRDRLGIAASEYVAQHLTWANYASQMLALFESAMDGHRTRA